MRVYNAAETAHYCGGAGAGREGSHFLQLTKYEGHLRSTIDNAQSNYSAPNRF